MLTRPKPLFREVSIGPEVRRAFPYEGITELEEALQQLRAMVSFTGEDLEMTYQYDAIDCEMYPTIESLRRDLGGYTLSDGNRITFVSEPTAFVPQEALDRVNAYYDKIDIVKAVGGCIHMKPDDRRYFEQRSVELFGGQVS